MPNDSPHGFYGVPDCHKSTNNNPTIPTIIIASTLQPASRRNGLSLLLLFANAYINEKILSFFEFIIFASEYLQIAATVKKKFPSLTSHDISDTFINVMPNMKICSALREYLKGTVFLDPLDPIIMVKLAIFGRSYFPRTALYIPRSLSSLWFRNFQLNLLSTASARTILYLLDLHFADLVGFPSKISMSHLVEFKNRIAAHCIRSLTIEEFADDVVGIKLCACDSPDQPPTLIPATIVPVGSIPPFTLRAPIDVDTPPPSPVYNPRNDSLIILIQERANALKTELDDCIRQHEEYLQESLWYEKGPVFGANRDLVCTSCKLVDN
jgi:hypothetical protein